MRDENIRAPEDEIYRLTTIEAVNGEDVARVARSLHHQIKQNRAMIDKLNTVLNEEQIVKLYETLAAFWGNEYREGFYTDFKEMRRELREVREAIEKQAAQQRVATQQRDDIATKLNNVISYGVRASIAFVIIVSVVVIGYLVTL